VELGHIFSGSSLESGASSLLVLLLTLGGFAVFNYLMNAKLFQAAPLVLRRPVEVFPQEIW